MAFSDVLCNEGVMRSLSLSTLLTAALVAGPLAASAQTLAPPTTAHPMRVPDAHMPLMMAYRTLGIAEAFGASGHYLDVARDHYRSALARLGRNDVAGAGAEARLAADLARVALADHPFPTPRDLPAPPSAAPRAPQVAADGPHPMVAPDGPHGGWGGGRGGHRGRRRGDMRGVSLAEVGRLLKVENTPEAHALADAAFAAEQSAQKAEFSGDVRTAMRQHHVAGALGAAVRDLALLDHPELRRPPAFGRMHRGPAGPGGPGGARPPSAADVPFAPDDDGSDS